MSGHEYVYMGEYEDIPRQVSLLSHSRIRETIVNKPNVREGCKYMSMCVISKNTCANVHTYLFPAKGLLDLSAICSLG